MTKLSQLKLKLRRLEYYGNDPLVREAIKKVREKRKPEIDRIKLEIDKLRNKRSGPKSRWPEDTPKEVLESCEDYFRGTTEFQKFRIHCWNDKAIWTSWPSDQYGPASFFLISRSEKGRYGRAKRLKELEGRQSLKKLKSLLPE